MRFASIPKCASRTLLKLGLLGELPGRCHTTIKQYPEWQQYRWLRVTRDSEAWLHDWWRECRKSNDLFASALGMRFVDFDKDMACFANASTLDDVPQRWGVNQWMPASFAQDFPAYLANGKTLYHYAVNVITDGIECETVSIEQLDEWLDCAGYPPTRENCHA